jgi:hypothetical protein
LPAGLVRDHSAIKSLERLRSEPIEAVISETGNQMSLDSDPISVITAPPYRRSSDILEPMLEPAGNGPPDAWQRNVSNLPFLLQLPNSGGDHGLGA